MEFVYVQVFVLVVVFVLIEDSSDVEFVFYIMCGKKEDVVVVLVYFDKNFSDVIVEYLKDIKKGRVYGFLCVWKNGVQYIVLE